MTKTRTTPLDRVALSDVFRYFPTVVALGAALLYVIGALAKMIELRAAHVDLRDGLAFVPVQQLLARGIGVSLSALAWLLLATATAFALPPLVRNLERRERRFDDVFAKGDAASRALWPLLLRLVLYAALALISVVLAPWPLIFPSVGAMASGYFAYHARPSLRTYLALTYAAAVTLVLISSLVSPALPPRATLWLRNGSAVTGRLIAFANGSWHLSRPDGAIRSYPEDRVLHTITYKREKRAFHRRSIAELVTGHDLPWGS
jgi:hypothetical protein